MNQSRPRCKRKFSLRWRGRRWYDPNERKVLWSGLCLVVATTLVRLLIVGDLLTHPTPLAAAMPAPAHGILGTVHDLSATGPNHVTESKEACIFCHAPHGTPEGLRAAIPYWNHATTTQQFVSYASEGLKGTVDQQPMGPSLVCLSCHDGTVAMGALHEIPLGGGQDNYSHATGGVNPLTGLMEGSGRVSRDLNSGHPVSVTYRDDLNKSLRPPGDLQGVRLYPSNTRGGKVECGSCHDPHNFGLKGSTAPFLRASKQGSVLCLSCHLV